LPNKISKLTKLHNCQKTAATSVNAPKHTAHIHNPEKLVQGLLFFLKRPHKRGDDAHGLRMEKFLARILTALGGQ